MMTDIFLAAWKLKELPLPVDTWWGYAIVLFVVIFAIWAVSRLIAPLTEDSDPAEIDRQMLTAINELHRQGDLSKEEFRSIKNQLVTRLADKLPTDDSAAHDDQSRSDNSDETLPPPDAETTREDSESTRDRIPSKDKPVDDD